ncbi:MAG: glycosyl hydrolase family 18 protein [Candidatus Nanopelagicales bacterium]
MHRRSTAARRLATLVAAALGLGLLGLAGPATTATAADAQPRPIVTGWGYFGSVDAASTKAAIANADLMPEASPFWYTAENVASPTVAEALPCPTCSPYAVNKDTVVPALQGAGVKVLPTITDGMAAGQLAAVLKDTTRRATLVSRIVSLVQTEGYDGIDLDFEGFAFADSVSSWTTTRPAWVAFIGQLSSALHARGKLLSVTTPPIYTGNRTTTSGTKWNDGYWVYDWAGIDTYVDRLRIMAYDYSVSGGPIAPLPWVEKILKYAVSVVPSGKVQIGVAAYGRNATVKVNGVSKVEGTCPTNKPANYLSTLSFKAADAGTAIPSETFTSATLNRSAAVRTWDATNGEWYFTYTVRYIGTTSGGKDTSCKVYRNGWYDNAASALARAKLVEKYRLRGIAQWNLDGAAPAQWSSLRSYAATIAPSSTKVAVYVPSVTTYGATASVAVRATSDGVSVPGAKAVLYARRAGTTTWTLVTSGTTDGSGRVALPHTVTASTQYKVNVAGDWARNTGSGTDATSVRTAIALDLSALGVKAGKTVTASVKLKPWITGQTVQRQVLAGGTWKTVQTAKADRYGRVSFSFKPTTAGTTYQYRIYAVGTSTVRGNYAYFAIKTS